MSRQTVRALARSKEVFYASVAGELFSGLFMGPIRGQMTRCILPTEIGKVAPVPAVPACQLVLQKVGSELHWKVRNHGEGPY